MSASNGVSLQYCPFLFEVRACSHVQRRSGFRRSGQMLRRKTRSAKGSLLPSDGFCRMIASPRPTDITGQTPSVTPSRAMGGRRTVQSPLFWFDRGRLTCVKPLLRGASLTPAGTCPCTGRAGCSFAPCPWCCGAVRPARSVCGGV